MRITIPDQVLDAYQAYADREGRTLDQVLTQQLGRFRHLPPAERAVVLGGPVIERLETHLGTQISNGEELADKVERLAGITFHGIHLDFSPNQLEELQHRSERSGRSVEDMAKEMVQQLSHEWFWRAGAGEAAVSVPPPAPTARQRKAG